MTPPPAPPPLPAPGLLLREAVTAPRDSLRRILALRLGMGDLWQVAALAAILSVLILYGGLAVTGPQSAEVLAMMPQPFLVATLQLGLTALMTLAVARVGAWAGGRGGLGAALAAMVWLQLLMVAVQLAQAVLSLLLPALGGFVGLAGVGLFFWLMTNFVAEVHGFRNLGQVFGGVVMTMIGAALGLGLLLSLVLGSMMGAG